MKFELKILLNIIDLHRLTVTRSLFDRDLLNYTAQKKLVFSGCFCLPNEQKHFFIFILRE